MHKKDDPQHHHKPSEECAVSGEVKVHGGIQVFETESSIEQHKSERKEDQPYKEATKTFEKSSLLTSRVGIVLTTLYLAATCFIFQESKRSADMAEKAVKQASDRFQIEQRPIIWTPNKITLPVHYAKTKQLVWDWWITNYGKTPAKDVRLYEYFKIGGGEWQRPPMSGPPRDYVYGAPMPPGKEDFKTIVTSPIDNSDEILKQDGGISIKIRITYKDAFGNSYESQLCFVHLATNAMQYCGPNEAYIDSPVTEP